MYALDGGQVATLIVTIVVAVALIGLSIHYEKGDR